MKKTLTVLLALVLVIAMSVTGTMAYLTSKDSVTNTFTVGNVKITLDEAPVDANGKKTDGARVQENKYKLIPGHVYDKDPTIHVDANSEDCWLFVKVEDGLANIEDNTTIASQMATIGWTATAEGSNIYAYKDVVSARDSVVVFNGFTLKGDAVVDGYANAQIKVTAYAVQADGFNTAADALKAAPFPTT